MKVYHISAECYPVAKAGGLADVVGALPRFQYENGIDASVIMPWYDKPFVDEHTFVSVYSGHLKQGTQLYSFEIMQEENRSLGFDLFMVRVSGLLDRPDIYGYVDESNQFLAFQQALLQWIAESEDPPTIFHCHDHHAGLIPFFIENCKEFAKLKGIPTVFTVHNGEYQGDMLWHKAVLMPEFDHANWGLLDWDNRINPMASAIKCCWAYTTVSEGYLEELQHQKVLGPLFLAEHKKSYGIVNGIDVEVWNPETDELIDHHYRASTLVSGKKKNKKLLCDEYDLNAKLPLIAFIGRFAREKGADLLPAFVQQIQKQTEQEVNVFILGSGDPHVEEALRKFRNDSPQNFALLVGYDEKLAHRIYASADFLIMPSRVEPCGLNQLYAMRFGTVPVVRAIGGLKDTVHDIEHENGNGFLFENASVVDLLQAVERALDFYESTEWKTLRTSNMALDYSWKNSAQKYKKVYDLLNEKL